MNEVLKYFFEAYFHQDWRDDYAISFGAIEEFIAKEPAELKLKLKDALFDMLHQGALPQDSFIKMGGSFKPEREGLTVESWIRQATDIIV